MNGYTYHTPKDGKVLFTCTAHNITEADAKLKTALGIDDKELHKPNHLFCTITFHLKEEPCLTGT